MKTKFKSKTSAYYNALLDAAKSVNPTVKEVTAIYVDEQSRKNAFDFVDVNGKRYIATGWVNDADYVIKFK